MSQSERCHNPEKSRTNESAKSQTMAEEPIEEDIELTLGTILNDKMAQMKVLTIVIAGIIVCEGVNSILSLSKMRPNFETSTEIQEITNQWLSEQMDSPLSYDDPAHPLKNQG